MRLHIKKTDKNIIKHEQCLSLNNEIMGHFNFLFLFVLGGDLICIFYVFLQILQNF